MTAVHSISVDVPEELYERLEKVAQHSRVPLEQALVEGMSWMYTRLPLNPSAILEELSRLSSVQLWAIIYQRLLPDDQTVMQRLMEKNQEELLTEDEQISLDHYLAMVIYQMQLRSKALLLLKERGEDIEQYRTEDVP